MNNLIIKTSHFCIRCKQELPLTAFYVNKRKSRPDNYCKECRKMASLKRYEATRCTRLVNNTRSYPVITEIQDHKQREVLILHALQVVAERQSRKRRIRWEEEDKSESK